MKRTRRRALVPAVSRYFAETLERRTLFGGGYMYTEQAAPEGDASSITLTEGEDDVVQGEEKGEEKGSGVYF